jgi:hypothetical protein
MTREAGGSSPPRRAKPREPKLYAVTRRDLPVGLRCAQVGHVLIAYALEHGPALPANLVVLEVADEAELFAVYQRAREADRAVTFFEPDLGGALTAIAVGPEAWREVSSLPLVRA